MIRETSIDNVFLAERDNWYRFAFGMTGSAGDAHDILHDAYERVRRKSSSSEISNIRGYLFLTIRNLCFDFVKKEKVKIGLGDDVLECVDSENSLEKSDEIQWLHKFLQRLPTAQRSVILLKDIEGYNFDEISKMLEMNKNNIRVNLSIARKKLREAFSTLRSNELKR